MKNKIIIIGGKGTAVNIAEGIVDAQEKYNHPVEFLGFAFDDELFGDQINGYPIVCRSEELYTRFGKYSDVSFIFQMNHQFKMYERSQLVASYNIPKEKWGTFIHPSAYVAKSVKIGYGSVVFAHCAIHSNVRIGNHCTFSALTTIGHDTQLNDHVFTATHVCIGSNVNIGECNFFGQNSTVTSMVNIARNNLIGLGASVINSLTEEGKIYVGSPTRILKSISSL